MTYAIGAYVEIKPAYSSETGSRSIWDDLAGLAGHIIAVSATSDDVLVRLLNGDEHWVYCQRLRLFVNEY